MIFLETVAGVQTEERRQADAKHKAAEAAAEAKQEADIVAYHARLRDKEAHKHHQPSLGREDQPAGLLGICFGDCCLKGGGGRWGLLNSKPTLSASCQPANREPVSETAG